MEGPGDEASGMTVNVGGQISVLPLELHLVPTQESSGHRTAFQIKFAWNIKQLNS